MRGHDEPSEPWIQHVQLHFGYLTRDEILAMVKPTTEEKTHANETESKQEKKQPPVQR